MEITIPILNYGNFIGRVGESIVEKYLRENDFIILGKEYKIPYIGARVDFIVTKNKERAKKFKKRPKIDFINYVQNHPECILAEFKGKEHMTWSYEKLSEINSKISEKNPDATIFHIGKDESIIFYNVLPAFEKEYSFLKENFCLIEVKASLGKYPKGMGGRKYTKAQKVHKYYDVLLRVKIEKNLENGFKGMIHLKDLERLNRDHRILE